MQYKATMWSVTAYFLVLILPIILTADSSADIVEQRTNLIQNELNLMVGNDIVLSDSELKLNEKIKELKFRDLDYAFDHPQAFNFSKHFFDYKDEVKKTMLFKIIQEMPKGAVLHAHDTGLLSPDYVLQLTYMDNLYACFFEDNVRFMFHNGQPTQTCGTQWQLVRDARFSSGNVKMFDEKLRKYFTLVVDNPAESYPNINAAWSKFQQYFIVASGIICYKPVWEKYFYDTLKAFRDDNIMYIEIRSVLPPLYDLEGNVYDSVATAESYKEVLDMFMRDYPDFFGAKLIYAPHRLVDTPKLKKYIKIAKEIKQKLPTFFAGFDLVGQEDLGTPTKDFIRELAAESNELDYFFHAGETNWSGCSSDENLVDAILLGAKRIGHAFALVKHPLLIKEIRKRDIALEVNVISNHVLKLVDDVRNHPLATFLAEGLPVVISSDDPGTWEADPLSHDFYVTFMGVASRHADLKLLKKLALNSLYYSTYPNKDKIVHEFEIRWTKFVDKVVKNEINEGSEL